MNETILEDSPALDTPSVSGGVLVVSLNPVAAAVGVIHAAALRIQSKTAPRGSDEKRL